MKKIIILLIVAAFFSINCFSQNWNPINKEETLNYSIKGDSINSSIWVDSVTYRYGVDSVLHLNKTLQIGGRYKMFGNYYVFKHSFLLAEIEFKHDGSYSLKNEQVQFFINPFKNSWIFDSINNITATIKFAKDSLVFNSLDSIKNIKLSNGDTIIISKNHGILKFPLFDDNHQHIKLIGIEGRNEGFITPYFNDVFNFQIGDVFEYDIEDQPSPHFSGDQTKKQITILEKETLVDTFLYVVSTIEKKNTTENSSIVYSKYNDTIIYAKKDYAFLDKNIYKFLEEEIYCSNSFFRIVPSGFNKTYSTYTRYHNSTTQLYQVTTDTFSYNHFFDDLVGGCFWSDENEYGSGVGLINHSVSYNTYYNRSVTKLIGCIKNGVQYGIITPDIEFIAPPVITNPIDLSTDLDKEIVFSWTETENTLMQFHFEISMDASFNNLYIDTVVALNNVNLELNAHTNYYARVRYLDGINNGSWSKIISFSIKNISPVPYIFISPIHDEIVEYIEGNLEILYSPNPTYDADGDVNVAIIRIDGPNLDTTIITSGNPGKIVLNSSLFRNNRTYSLDGKITDGNVIIDADQINFKTPFSTGVDNIAHDIGLKVWPIPATNNLNVQLNYKEHSASIVRFYNPSGKLIDFFCVRFDENHPKNIDVSSLDNGIYLMQIILNKSALQRTIVINR